MFINRSTGAKFHFQQINYMVMNWTIAFDLNRDGKLRTNQTKPNQTIKTKNRKKRERNRNETRKHAKMVRDEHFN